MRSKFLYGVLAFLPVVLAASVQAQIIGSPVPGIILDTQLLSVEGDAGAIQTGGLLDGVEGFVDRVGQTWEVIPAQLVGADYIKTAQFNADVRDVEIAVTVADATILHVLIPELEEPEVFPFYWMNELDFGAEWVKTGALIPTSWTVPAEVWSTATPLSAGTYVFKDIPKDPEFDEYGSFYGIAATQASPANMIAGLVGDVIGLNLQKGITNSLDSKLDSALNALEDLNTNNDVAAINSLQAFINAVQAQRGNKIPEADADSLIASAQAIIDLLNAS